MSPSPRTRRRGRARRLTSLGVLVLLAAIVAGSVMSPAESQDQISTTTTSTTGRPTSTTGKPTDPTSTSSTSPARPSTSVIQHAGGGGSPIPLPAASLVVLDQPRSARALASLGVESAEFDAAIDAYHSAIEDYRRASDALPSADGRIDAALARQQSTAATFRDRVSELGDLLTAKTRLQGELVSATRRRDKADGQLALIRADLQTMAVGAYMAGGFGGAPEQIFDLDHANEFGSRQVMLSLVKRDRVAELRTIKAFHDDNDRIAQERQAELDDVSRRIATTEAGRDQAVRDRDAAVADEQRARDDKAKDTQTVADRKADVDERRDAVAVARLGSTVPEIGLPFVVVNAYVLAAEKMAVEQPSCGLRWYGLAGIGRTESNHGTFGGATVDRDGNETKPIYGIALDGSNGTANIGDTDGGALDNDSGTDRAAGPMQFIPSTWRTLGRDGNGDGNNDPQNFYDAALSAANLLCRAGPGLETDDGMRRAFRSYNNDGNYVETVLERAHDYSRFTFPASDAASDPAKSVPGLTVPVP